MLELSASVGKGGRNAPNDVRAVQALLVQIGLKPGTVNGTCGVFTIAAIETLQSAFTTAPDGRVDPGGKTWEALLGKATPRGRGVIVEQWDGDSALWTQQKKLLSLEPAFRTKVKQVIRALQQQALQPSIVFGWRSVETQRCLFAAKKTTVLFSFHNVQSPDGTPSSLAADIIDKRWAWTKAAQANGFWEALGAAGKKQGLIWGGDWKTFPDIAHLQGRRNSELAEVKRESGL